jgi:hypothetical protein
MPTLLLMLPVRGPSALAAASHQRRISAASPKRKARRQWGASGNGQQGERGEG